MLTVEIPIKACPSCWRAFTHRELERMARGVGENASASPVEVRCFCGGPLVVDLRGNDNLSHHADLTAYARAFPGSTRPHVAVMQDAARRAVRRRWARLLLAGLLALAVVVACVTFSL